MTAGFRLLEWTMRGAARLPMGVLYAFSDIGYLLLRYVVRYRLRTVRANLAASFPDKSRSELRRIERGFYRHFADNAVESVKMLHISADEMRRRMRFENVELIDRLFGEGRDIVAYFSHCGNWEWATSVALNTRTRSGSEADYGFVYRPLKEKLFDAMMLEIRTRFGASAYPKATVFRELIRLRRSGKRFITGFMSDQKPSHGDPTQVLMFLNHPTAMITGTETVARKLDTAVIYWDMRRERRGYYVIDCKLVALSAAAEKQGRVTAEYARLLQQTIERQPSMWLWTHKRWKNPVNMSTD
ncbi:MAG: lysophospholipid acyltransferase family protein [Muribaculaceae bacterium]|nr:lysophospholipid acyltransferase family protein [Muribaculaceae bacterium]